MEDEGPPPGWLYAVGWSIVGVGIILGIVRLFSLIPDFDTDVAGMPRAAMPGELRVQVAAASDYTIYQELTSTVDGQPFLSGPTPVSVSCTLADPAGQPVQLKTHSFTHSNYSFPPYQGTSVFTFHSGTAGTYALNCSTDPENQQAVLAVGQFDAFGGLGPAFAVILLSIMIGVGIFLIHFFRRRSWFRRHRPAFPGYGYPYGTPGGPPGYGQAPYGQPPPAPPPPRPAYGQPVGGPRLRPNDFGRRIVVPSLVAIWALSLVWMYTSG